MTPERHPTCKSPVFPTAQWRHLVLLNYLVDPQMLKAVVPAGTELDSWQGRTFVSVVGFRFLETRVLGLPIPFHRNFEEVNLRFYVRRRAEDGWRRGVVFVREVVPRRAIAAIARWVYNERYVACAMSSSLDLPEGPKTEGSVAYSWMHAGRPCTVRAKFREPRTAPAVGSEAEYITEHYWGYVSRRDGATLEYRVEHPRWRVWSTTEASLEGDVAGFYGSEYAEALSGPLASAFVADGSPVVVRRGRLIETPAPQQCQRATGTR